MQHISVIGQIKARLKREVQCWTRDRRDEHWNQESKQYTETRLSSLQISLHLLNVPPPTVVFQIEDQAFNIWAFWGKIKIQIVILPYTDCKSQMLPAEQLGKGTHVSLGQPYSVYLFLLTKCDPFICHITLHSLCLTPAVFILLALKLNMGHIAFLKTNGKDPPPIQLPTELEFS